MPDIIPRVRPVTLASATLVSNFLSDMVNTQRLRLACHPEMRLNLHVVSSSFNKNLNVRSTFGKLSLYRFLNLYPKVRVEVMCQMWTEGHNAFLH